jgi:hypothetical protein
MARPRLPSNVLDARGAFDRHPERRRKDAIGASGGIGIQPERLTAEQRQAWLELADEAPPGVLTRTDRISLEIMSMLLAKIRNAFDLRTVAELRMWLVQYGFTAASRARIAPVPEPPKSRFTEFAS